MEMANAKEVIALQRQLSEEKEQRQQIVKHAQAIRDNVNSTSISEEVKRLKAISPTTGTTKNQELQNILTGTEAFEAAVATSRTRSFPAKYSQLATIVTANLTNWKARDQAAADQIEAKRKALEAQPGPAPVPERGSRMRPAGSPRCHWSVCLSSERS